jgi:signal transduction histidine kinase
MVNDLLLFARPTPPRLTPVPVLALVEDAAGLLSGDAGLGRVQVEVRGPALSVLADPQLLKPVLLNLLLNAGQAMQGKGKISVSVAAGNDMCELTVSDHGPGIVPEVRDRIFEPFFSTKHRGTGLGLPIARRIIEAHGGEIDVSCPAAGGTVVVVRLPLAR